MEILLTTTEDMSPKPATPIVGSSPKKSWFSAFFAKADKDPGSTSHPGVASQKSIFEITSALQRGMEKLNITWEMANNRTIRAKSRVPHGMD